MFILYANFVGWDTETYKGLPYLTGYYDFLAKEYEYLYYPEILKENPKITDKMVNEILTFLSKKEVRKFFNCFYNVQFDYESLIKFCMRNNIDELTLKHYEELIKYGETYFQKNRFFFIHEKYFEVNNNKYYDMFPFFRTRLDKAGQKYLGRGKLEAEIQYDNKEWLLDNIDTVIEYHKRDCELLSELAYYTCMNWEKLGYTFWNPISLGTISAYNFKKRTGLKRISQLEPYYNRIISSYFGGMFDIWKRGTFEKVYSYDLNSCYPYVISELLSLDNCRIVQLNEFDDFYDYSYYCCNAYFEHPFKATKYNGKNYYFVGWHFGIWLTKQEILLLEKLGWKCEVLNGIGIHVKSKRYLFKKEVRDTYDKRMSFDKDHIYNYLLKIYLNSLYGKFKQYMKNHKVFGMFSVDQLHLMEAEKEKLSKRNDNLEYYQFVNGMVGIVSEVILKGSISNPVYATEITSIPRLELIKASIGHREKVISFNTDSIITTSPIDSLKLSDDLGGWDLEVNGKTGTFLNVGIYCVYDKPVIKDSFYKESFRGALGDQEDKLKKPVIGQRLYDSLQTEDIEFHVRKKQFKHMRSMVKSKCPERINLFEWDEKDIQINQGERREWQRNFDSGYDCLENSISSYPLDIDDYFIGKRYNYVTV